MAELGGQIYLVREPLAERTIAFDRLDHIKNSNGGSKELIDQRFY